MKKILLFVAFIFTALLVNGCLGEVSIKELHTNSEKYMGEEVTTSGIIERTTKLLDFTGFTLIDEKGENSIFVQLPPGSALLAEGTKVRVKGTLQKGLFGYHLYASEVIEI